MRVKISHEVPKCLLEKSREFNDYDFCLPHLMDKNHEYADFFYESKKMGRYIIMDNSLHELGQAYDYSRLRHWLEELEPDEFIVPDVWLEKSQTLAQAKYWKQYEDLYENTTFVAVVQGKSFSEANECYSLLKDLGYKKIAFSYAADWYMGLAPYDSKYPDVGKMMGRISVIEDFYYKGTIKDNDRVHLLGCSLPQEFQFYKDYSFIESIDTSSPIMATLDNTLYSPEGLRYKPKSNLNNHFDIPKENIDMAVLKYNLTQFKEINQL